jgi:NitT/TauT family transport system permease protein
VWECAGRLAEIRPDILPTPSRIALEFWRNAALVGAGAESTCLEVLTGLLLAMVLALAFASIVLAFPRAERRTSSIINFFADTPFGILTPVLVVWFGYGIWPKVTVVLLLCLFSIIRGIVAGSRTIPRELTDFVQVTRAGWVQSFLKVILPMSLPGFFRGLRTAASLAIVGAATAEFAEADAGLGSVMLLGMARLNTPLVFAALAGLAAIGLTLYTVVVLLGRLLIPWGKDRG